MNFVGLLTFLKGGFLIFFYLTLTLDQLVVAINKISNCHSPKNLCLSAYRIYILAKIIIQEIFIFKLRPDINPFNQLYKDRKKPL